AHPRRWDLEVSGSVVAGLQPRLVAGREDHELPAVRERAVQADGTGDGRTVGLVRDHDRRMIRRLMVRLEVRDDRLAAELERELRPRPAWERSGLSRLRVLLLRLL